MTTVNENPNVTQTGGSSYPSGSKKYSWVVGYLMQAMLQGVEILIKNADSAGKNTMFLQQLSVAMETYSQNIQNTVMGWVNTVEAKIQTDVSQGGDDESAKVNADSSLASEFNTVLQNFSTYWSGKINALNQSAANGTQETSMAYSIIQQAFLQLLTTITSFI